MAEMRKYRRQEVDHQPSVEGGDEVVRILTELTGDFERFDFMIHDQRSALELQPGKRGRGDDVERESSRLRLEAAEMAVRTRKALDQLRKLAEPVKSRARG
jgi:hypothetical protein